MQQNRTILTVSELNAEVALLLKDALPLLWLEGEISNLARPSSGHWYFSLKDSKAQVRCVMFRNRSLRTRCKPENGLKILIQVKAGLYEPRGEYQLIVEQMEEAGEGQLQKAFEALKKKLSKQGLFEHGLKKDLPYFPNRIGIITSPTGAAVQDIINILKRRCPQIPSLIYPVAVQGELAAPQIVNALQQANHDKKCDVILLARGGGSIEDLWAFNEEVVAHAIHQSEIPIVTGVGHEIDFTIADFVSDHRAPTPSAAAELVSPDSKALEKKIKTLKKQLLTHIKSQLSSKQEKFTWVRKTLHLQSPENRLQQYAQKLDDLEIRLESSLNKRVIQRKIQLQALKQRLFSRSPQRQYEQQKNQLQLLTVHLNNHVHNKLNTEKQNLRNLGARLNAISPLATLQRGYAIARNEAGLIRSVKQVSKSDNISVLVADGELNCRIIKKTTTKATN